MYIMPFSVQIGVQVHPRKISVGVQCSLLPAPPLRGGQCNLLSHQQMSDDSSEAEESQVDDEDWVDEGQGSSDEGMDNIRLYAGYVHLVPFWNFILISSKIAWTLNVCA